MEFEQTSLQLLSRCSTDLAKTLEHIHESTLKPLADTYLELPSIDDLIRQSSLISEEAMRTTIAIKESTLQIWNGNTKAYSSFLVFLALLYSFFQKRILFRFSFLNSIIFEFFITRCNSERNIS